MDFRLNLHSTIVGVSRNSLLKAEAISEFSATATGLELTTA